jgi:hypothetical protein
VIEIIEDVTPPEQQESEPEPTPTEEVCVALTLEVMEVMEVMEGEGSITALTAENCEGGYLEGTIVTIAAQPAEGYVLSGRQGSDDDVSADLQNTITITEPNNTVSISLESIVTGSCVVGSDDRIHVTDVSPLPHRMIAKLKVKWGIDMLLSWNSAFYLDICTSYYGEFSCGSGYLALTSTQWKFLQNVYLLRRGTDEEFDLIAETLYAGCNQTAQIIRNVTKKEPNEVAGYKDLWHMTLGVYNAGCCCIGDAMQDTMDRLVPEEDGSFHFGWEDIFEHLPEGCEPAADYFDKAVRYGVQ